MKTKTTRTKPLTREEKAVAIVEDALAQLLAKRYRASPGTYVGGDLIGKLGRQRLKGKLNTQMACRKSKCDVCAKGAILVSKASLFNHVDVSTVLYSHSLSIKASVPEIEPVILDEMENWFERRHMRSVCPCSFSAYTHFACAFLPKSPKGRLEWLLRRLIKTRCQSILLTPDKTRILPGFQLLTRRLKSTEV